MKKTLTFLSLALGLASAAPTFAQDRHFVYEAPPAHTEAFVRPTSGHDHAVREEQLRYELARQRRDRLEWRARVRARLHAQALEREARRERSFASGRPYRSY